ncbi:MAG: hypothetical protein AMXMBFR83_01900 [Phycisphaerae bacterium]
MDTPGLILAVAGHTANVQDRDGAKAGVEQAPGSVSAVETHLGRRRLRGKLVDWTRRLGGRIREIVKRGDDVPGFEVLPKRWIVERTFGWLGRHRRLSRDDETLTAGGEAMIHLVMINVMLHRLASK